MRWSETPETSELLTFLVRQQARIAWCRSMAVAPRRGRGQVAAATSPRPFRQWSTPGERQYLRWLDRAPQGAPGDSLLPRRGVQRLRRSTDRAARRRATAPSGRVRRVLHRHSLAPFAVSIVVSHLHSASHCRARDIRRHGRPTERTSAYNRRPSTTRHRHHRTSHEHSLTPKHRETNASTAAHGCTFPAQIRRKSNKTEQIRPEINPISCAQRQIRQFRSEFSRHTQRRAPFLDRRRP